MEDMEMVLVEALEDIFEVDSVVELVNIELLYNNLKLQNWPKHNYFHKYLSYSSIVYDLFKEYDFVKVLNLFGFSLSPKYV